jgi:hypothetical protein
MACWCSGVLCVCVCVCVRVWERERERGRRGAGYQPWEGPGWWKVCSKIGYVTQSGIIKTSYEFSGCSALNLHCKLMTFRVSINYSWSTIRFSHSHIHILLFKTDNMADFNFSTKFVSRSFVEFSESVKLHPPLQCCCSRARKIGTVL